MRFRLTPALALLLLAPFIGEVLSGSTPPLELLNPVSALFLIGSRLLFLLGFGWTIMMFISVWIIPHTGVPPIIPLLLLILLVVAGFLLIARLYGGRHVYRDTCWLSPPEAWASSCCSRSCGVRRGQGHVVGWCSVCVVDCFALAEAEPCAPGGRGSLIDAYLSPAKGYL